MNIFTLTKNHMKLLRLANVSWCDDETGAPSIDPKRPYGNSNVELDVAEALGWKIGEELTEEQFDRAWEIHQETEKALQIVLSNLPDLTGNYVQEKEYDDTSWRLKK